MAEYRINDHIHVSDVDFAVPVLVKPQLVDVTDETTEFSPTYVMHIQSF